MGEMTDKVVLVTGASRGIGAAAAREFAANGAKVALLARSRGAIAEIAGELGADTALAVPCDISRYWEVRAAVDACCECFGRLDILINNAGVIEPIARLSEVDPQTWAQAIDINLKGVFHGMRAAIPAMAAGGGGTIITISSGAAHRPTEGWSHYCASKAAAAMLIRMVDVEERHRGIRAMGLSPGTVATEMQKEIKASGVNPISDLDWSEHIPPEWVAKALLWMAGPAGEEWLGREASLRDDEVRRAVGLIG